MRAPVWTRGYVTAVRVLGGRRAQAAFWGDADPERSMLQQLALAVA